MDDVTPKKPWQSSTIWAVVGMTVVAIGSLFGVAFSQGDAAEIGAALGSIATGVFGLIAIWRRIAATQTIG